MLKLIHLLFFARNKTWSEFRVKVFNSLNSRDSISDPLEPPEHTLLSPAQC